MIELLYFTGCPSWQITLADLREQLGEDASIDLILVETPEEAQKQRFVGSPTIRVAGKDLFPVEAGEYTLGCRIYHTPEGLRGSPTAGMLRDALRQRGVLKG